ncbi:MAG: F-box protein, partial [Alphaproteobacteria bacterium]|nr:F-box protein [Alphaproteobacteria bacterium]
MRALKTILITTSLLLGLSMSVLASDNQEEFGSPSSKKRPRDHPSPSSENNDIPAWILDTLIFYDISAWRFDLPDELVAMIVSSLPRKDQVSARRVSRSIKRIIDELVWPQQSGIMKGYCLSVAIDTIKSLPFQSFKLEFDRWVDKDIESLSLLTNLTHLDVESTQLRP